MSELDSKYVGQSIPLILFNFSINFRYLLLNCSFPCFELFLWVNFLGSTEDKAEEFRHS